MRSITRSIGQGSNSHMTDLQLEYLLYYIENHYGKGYILDPVDAEIVVAEFQNRPDDSELGVGG